MHLVRRFFDVASARPLSGSEHSAVDGWLTAPLARLFFAQPVHDQRHGYHAALSIVAAGIKDKDVIVAALTHDIGKRHAGLGLVGRSVASLMIITGLPLTERMRDYRDHGLIAARELSEVPAPSLAIEFALHHHGERPETIEAQIWDALVAADQPPKTLGMLRGRITSDTT